MLTYGSVCSGIESASVAWHPLGWRAEWFAEIEPFPSAVLAYRWPEVSNLGDMTKLARQVLAGSIAAPEVLVGGTPCQAFSVAGMRAGLDDPRGQLTIKYVELADAVDHVRALRGEAQSIVVWENVPGVLSDKGNAFGCFLGALAGEDCELQPAGKRWQDAGCVYGPKRTIAWRVLDAQYFGLAQRRRRVFVVASARTGFDPAAVLFEREGLRRDHPPSRGQGKNASASSAPGVDLRNGAITGDVAHTVQAGQHAPDPGGTPHVLAIHGTQDPDIRNEQAHTLGRNSGQENAVFAIQAGALRTNPLSGSDGVGVQADHAYTLEARAEVQAVAFVQNSRDEVRLMGGDGQTVGALAAQPRMKQQCYIACREVAQTITSNYGKQCDNSDTALGPNVVAVALRGREGGATAELGDDLAGCLRASTGGGDKPHALVRSAVRRLTPRECERLQGFPDDHTMIPWRGKPAEECPDGPRYKAIGNSKAVPVVRWIGMRIQRELERAQ